MEHGANHSQHHRESNFNHDLFCHRNKRQRLLGHGDCNSFCGFIHYGDRDGLTGNYLYRRIQHTYGQRRHLLTMEHRANDSQHHGESNFDNDLFCHRNKRQRLLRHGDCNSLCGFIPGNHGNCIAGGDLRGWLQHAHR